LIVCFLYIGGIVSRFINNMLIVKWIAVVFIKSLCQTFFIEWV